MSCHMLVLDFSLYKISVWSMTDFHASHCTMNPSPPQFFDTKSKEVSSSLRDRIAATPSWISSWKSFEAGNHPWDPIKLGLQSAVQFYVHGWRLGRRWCCGPVSLPSWKQTSSCASRMAQRSACRSMTIDPAIWKWLRFPNNPMYSWWAMIAV